MEEIKEYWNDDEFIHYDKKQLEKLGLQEDTVEFLSTVGLLTGTRFTGHGLLRFLAEFQEETIRNEEYIKIASPMPGSEGLYIKKGVDYVYYINLPTNYHGFTKKLCNTKIYNFVKFQTIKLMGRSNYPNVDDDELEGYQCAREVIEAFKKVDPAAVHPYSYWANQMLNYAIDYFYDEDEKFEAAIKLGKYASSEEAYFDALFHGMQVLQA